MNLTEHFTLEELTRSAKAAQLGIDNTPDPDLVPRLVVVAEMLERIRSTLGRPLVVTSGYRGERLNAAVGGVATSDHLQANAADFVCPGYGTATEVARALAPLVSTIGIGQLILEGVKGKQWVHVSVRKPAREVNRVLTITDAGPQAGIVDLA